MSISTEKKYCRCCGEGRPCQSDEWRPILIGSKYDWELRQFTLKDGNIVKEDELPSYHRIVQDGSMYASYNPIPLLVAKYDKDSLEIFDVHCE